MPPHPLIVFLLPPDEAQSNLHCGQRRMAKLEAHGFQLQVCHDAPGAHLRLHRARASAVATVVVLAGNHTQNNDAARYLRALWPDIGILALMQARNDAACIQVLHSGADAWCPAGASLPLLVAMMFSLLRRLAPASGLKAMAPDARDHGWSLHEGESVLMGPVGGRIPLTTGERAFITTLLAAEGLRAPHCRLIDAVNACYASPAPRTHQARLGVLISRLRRKFARYGYDMPLKSVHNWGYMFTGRLASPSAGNVGP